MATQMEKSESARRMEEVACEQSEELIDETPENWEPCDAPVGLWTGVCVERLVWPM